MKRPLVFAIELVAAMLLATFGAWATAKYNGKFNREATALEGIKTDLARAFPPRPALPPPSLLHLARARIRIIERPAPPEPCVPDEFACQERRFSRADNPHFWRTTR